MPRPQETDRPAIRSDFLTGVLATVRAGGQETLQKAPVFSCADLTHEPFRVLSDEVQIRGRSEQTLVGMVKTSGAQFSGDRTDIHDVFSLIWGAVLRGFGIASVQLIDESHGFVPGELGARYLLFGQSPWKVTGSSIEAARRALNAWSAFSFHLLDDVFQWEQGRRETRHDRMTDSSRKTPAWSARISKALKDPKDFIVSRRTFPRWAYCSSKKCGVTVVRLPSKRLSNLRAILGPFSPQIANGVASYAILANGIPNAIPYDVYERARDFLALTKDVHKRVLAVPLDSHCLFIGNKTIVALRGEYGRSRFEDERQRTMARRAIENQVFMVEAVVQWRKPLDAGALEDMCVELVRREPGVVWAKPVGGVYDRDGGRDILIDWKTPREHVPGHKIEPSEGSMPRGRKSTRIIRVIAQVKLSSRTIGKTHVRDIRDTLDHYDADGFLLVAHSRISSGLVDHLDKLRMTIARVDWWEAVDLEERLRRHPDIAQRYDQLVSLRANP